jgi:superfamily II RNA helicase
MAGRAGRRGLDAVGTVVVAAWEDVPGEAELRSLLTGGCRLFGRVLVVVRLGFV